MDNGKGVIDMVVDRCDGRRKMGNRGVWCSAGAMHMVVTLVGNGEVHVVVGKAQRVWWVVTHWAMWRMVA